MCRCWLCGAVSHNEAEFEVSYGREDRLLRVCRWCREDLTLFGVRLNQVVRLPLAAKHVVMVVFGSGLSLFMERENLRVRGVLHYTRYELDRPNCASELSTPNFNGGF
jgi:hypothetical protein